MAPAEASLPSHSSNTIIMTVKNSNNGSSPKPVVAVDVDEVLGHLVPQLCKFHNSTYSSELTPEAFTCYQFHEVWGGTREDADRKMRQFFESPFFLEGDEGHGIPVVTGAVDVLRKHVGRLDLHIVTSRQTILREHTVAWVQANYPDIFTKLHFGNHHSLEGEVRSKPDLCRDIDAVMIIEDNMRYAMECSEAGIRTCLFGNYAWNRTSEDLPHNIHRAFSWDDVDKALHSVASNGDAAPSQTNETEAAREGEETDGVQNKADSEKAENHEQDEAKGGGKIEGTRHNGSAGGGNAGTSNIGSIEEDSGYVVVVEASKKVPDLVDMATKRLVHHEAVCLRSLEKGHSLGVDAVQELERLGIATTTSVKTSLVELSSGSRTCVEITVARTQKFSKGLSVAAAGDESIPATVCNTGANGVVQDTEVTTVLLSRMGNG